MRTRDRQEFGVGTLGALIALRARNSVRQAETDRRQSAAAAERLVHQLQHRAGVEAGEPRWRGGGAGGCLSIRTRLLRHTPAATTPPRACVTRNSLAIYRK